MSVETVKNYFKEKNFDVDIRIFEDTSTVEKAAEALGVTEGEIVKSLLLTFFSKNSPTSIGGEMNC